MCIRDRAITAERLLADTSIASVNINRFPIYPPDKLKSQSWKYVILYIHVQFEKFICIIQPAPSVPSNPRIIAEKSSIAAQYIIVIVKNPAFIFDKIALFLPKTEEKNIESAFVRNSSEKIPDTKKAIITVVIIIRVGRYWESKSAFHPSEYS